MCWQNITFQRSVLGNTYLAIQSVNFNKTPEILPLCLYESIIYIALDKYSTWLHLVQCIFAIRPSPRAVHFIQNGGSVLSDTYSYSIWANRHMITFLTATPISFTVNSIEIECGGWLKRWLTASMHVNTEVIMYVPTVHRKHATTRASWWHQITSWLFWNRDSHWYSEETR